MPKRNHDEDSDEYLQRKIQKLEKKLRKRGKRPRLLSSSSSESGHIPLDPSLPSPHKDDHEPLIAETIELDEHIGQTTQAADLEPRPGPSTPALVDSDECPLDDEILELLGASPAISKKLGEKIQRDIALRWEHIVTTGLSKEARKELIEKYLVPENCTKLSAPLLNPEIKAALSDVLIGQDKAGEFRQNQLASVISCIGEALTRMLKSDHKDASVIKTLLEGAQLLCDTQYKESMKRRSAICATVRKEIKSLLYETEIDTYLFGEKLTDNLRAAKAINKSGSEIRASKTKTVASRVQSRNLNSKPQLASSRQPVRRRQDPAAYQQAIATPLQIPQVQRQYYLAPPPPPPPPPTSAPPPPPPPPPAPQTQQRQRQRPYQRR